MSPFRSLALSAVILCSALPGWGQKGAGEIHIDVKDSSAAPQVATGKLQNLSTGENTSFETDAQGMSALTGLTDGRYRIELTKAGFATQSITVDLRSHVTGVVLRPTICWLGPLRCRERIFHRRNSGSGPDGERARPGSNRIARPN